MELFSQWNKQDPVSSVMQGRSVYTPVEPSFEYAAPVSTPAVETPGAPDAVVKESASGEHTSPVAESEIINVEDFTYDGYQVVRGEFFAHVYEPSITFNRNKITFSTACLRKMPEVQYVQFMVNPDSRTLVVRPCSEDEKDCLAWCTNGKRKPRAITARVFNAMIVDLLGWNPENRYKLLGKIIRNNNELLLLFDLTASEMYVRTCKEGEKPRTSRTPIYPADWKNQFGLPVEDHQKLLQVNIFEGYTVFSVQDRKENTEANATVETTVGGETCLN